MSQTIIDIKRVAVALHGVSSLVVEAAVSGLEEEVRRRLGVMPIGGMAPLDIAELAISPVRTETVLDAASLRGIIADRLVQAIREVGSAASTISGGPA